MADFLFELEARFQKYADDPNAWMKDVCFAQVAGQMAALAGQAAAVAQSAATLATLATRPELRDAAMAFAERMGNDRARRSAAPSPSSDHTE